MGFALGIFDTEATKDDLWPNVWLACKSPKATFWTVIFQTNQTGQLHVSIQTFASQIEITQPTTSSRKRVFDFTKETWRRDSNATGFRGAST